ncbi:hypothetical protein DY000_02049691 [Brassica cretica]|uniref:Uncharacterized protein n=1 Tax=Brassica cretica TaxID=69181 RepID=A0ABQ7F484_BRACR|nr:hypothetical protein DY000_02049691 [Brassica cretica]
MDDVTVRQIAEVCISFVSRVQRLSACGCMALLPPPKLQAIAPRQLALCDIGVTLGMVASVGHFRDVSVRTADIGRWEVFIFIAAYQLCMEESSYSETRHRDEAAFLRCYPLDGLAVTTSSSVGLHEGKSSDSWSGA